MKPFKQNLSVVIISLVATIIVITILIIPHFTEHSHLFTESVPNSSFLASEANCQLPAMYYKSCSCGEKGIEVFPHGEPNSFNHVYINKFYDLIDELTHKTITICKDCNVELSSVDENHDGNDLCSLCNQNIHKHIYNQEIQALTFMKNNVNCLEPLTYYKSCNCGQQGIETFTVGEPLGHDYSKETTRYLAVAANCVFPAKYYLVCIRCDAKGTTTHVYGERDPINHIGDELITYDYYNIKQHRKIVTCTFCEEEKTAILENHEYVDGIVNCIYCYN